MRDRYNLDSLMDRQIEINKVTCIYMYTQLQRVRYIDRIQIDRIQIDRQNIDRQIE